MDEDPTSCCTLSVLLELMVQSEHMCVKYGQSMIAAATNAKNTRTSKKKNTVH